MTPPFLCVFVAFLLHMGTKIPVGFAQARLRGGYDNRFPRDQQATLSGWGRRALAAHHNTLEAFPPFAAAVLVCHAAGGDADWAARLSVGFVVARIAYPLVYIGDLPTLRSAIWGAGAACNAALFLLPMFGSAGL